MMSPILSYLHPITDIEATLYPLSVWQSHCHVDYTRTSFGRLSWQSLPFAQSIVLSILKKPCISSM